MESHITQFMFIKGCGDLIDKNQDPGFINKDVVLTSFEELNEANNREDFQPIFDELEKYTPRFEGMLLLNR